MALFIAQNLKSVQVKVENSRLDAMSFTGARAFSSKHFWMFVDIYFREG
jgi:hypothetical protein